MMLHGFPEETPSDLNHFRQMRVDLRALTGASLACPLPTPRKRTQDRTERTRRFLRSIAVPEPQIAEIEPLGATHSQAELFSSISLLRANGCAWKLIPEAIKDSREPNIEFASILFARRSEFRLPSLRYYGRLRDAQFNTNTTASLESRPPFECDFLGYSCTTLPLLPHVKAESDGFGLHLLPEAERKFQQLPLLKHDPLHIYGPHAYLRYYTIPETNQIIVTHIQCRSIDLHPDLPDSRRFMDVARVLMAGFEHFISSTNYYGTEPCIVFAPRCVLSVEGARYSPLITGRELTGLRDTQRWKDAYAEVLRVFERELLKDGYEDTVYLQRLQVFDKQGHPIIPGRLLCKQATKSRYAPYISELKRNRFSLWYKVGMKICASVTKDHEVQEGARRARTASAQAHFEARVHRTNPALAAIPGMDLIEIVPQMVDGTLSGHESALGKDGVAILLREIERVHGKHPIPFRLGWLSRGGQHVTKDWTVLADKRSKGTHFIPLHLEGMDRHPTIAIAEHDHNGNLCRAAFVGMKAGGLRELLPCHDVHPAPAGVELPIYASKRGGQPWGGAFLHDVFKEACHLQSLHMGVLFTYGHAAAAPMPILSGQPMRLPFRPDGRLEWVECKDYIKKFMGKRRRRSGCIKNNF
jgi:hypothetical protein